MPPPLQQAAAEKPFVNPGPLNATVSPVIVSGYACAAIWLLFLPIVYGPLGAALGSVASTRKAAVHGTIIIELSCSMACLGFAIGAAMFALHS